MNTPYCPTSCRSRFPRMVSGPLLLSLAASVFLSGAPAYATSATWNAGNGGWDVDANWNPSTGAPGATSGTTNGETATFGQTTGRTITVDAYRNIQNITFDTGAGSYTLTGGALHLSSGGTMAFNGTSAAATINVNSAITLEGNYTFSAITGVNASVINIGQAGTSTQITTGAASGTTTLTLSGGNGSGRIITINDIIADGANAKMAVTASVADKFWYLAGANTYTGATKLTTGGLNVTKLADAGSASSIGAASSDASNLVISGGASLYYKGAGDSTNRLFTLAGTGGNVSIYANGTGAVNFTNTGSIAAAQTANSTLLLRGTNTGANTLAASIGDAAGGFTTALTKVDAGTWVLSGANTFTGATAVNGGILNFQNSTAFGTNSAITVTSGATVQVQEGIEGGSKTLSIAGAGAIGATGALENVSGNNSYAGQVTLGTGGATISSDSGTLNLTKTGNTITGTAKALILTGAGNGNISGAIATTTGSVTKNGAGTWTLSGVNTYTGATSVNAGTLIVNGSLAAGSLVAVAAGATLGGSGTIAGATTVDGILAPGDNIGTLNIANDVIWNGTATNAWKFELGALDTADLLNINGSFIKGTGTVGTDFVFDFADTGAVGSYKLVDWTNTSGIQFANADFSYANLGSGLIGSFTVNGTELDFTVVPEPATWIMLVSGLGMLFTMQKLRRRQVAA